MLAHDPLVFGAPFALQLLELGFATSIRKEWEWRKLRGEPTHNLDAFRGWLEAEDSARGEDSAERE